MEKLKTLKNIVQCPHCKAEDKPKCVQYLELRKEAIKWIKEFGKMPKLYEAGFTASAKDSTYTLNGKEVDKETYENASHSNELRLREYNERQGIVHWIKKFFNISEEDLK